MRHRFLRSRGLTKTIKFNPLRYSGVTICSRQHTHRRRSFVSQLDRPPSTAERRHPDRVHAMYPAKHRVYYYILKNASRVRARSYPCTSVRRFPSFCWWISEICCACARTLPLIYSRFILRAVRSSILYHIYIYSPTVRRAPDREYLAQRQEQARRSCIM